MRDYSKNWRQLQEEKQEKAGKQNALLFTAGILFLFAWFFLAQRFLGNMVIY